MHMNQPLVGLHLHNELVLGVLDLECHLFLSNPLEREGKKNKLKFFETFY